MLAGLLASLALSGLWTASDPFVGAWKLDVSRSVIVDQMVVEAAGPDKFTFRFEGAPAETIIADGTEQPGVQGTTLAVKAEGPRRMSVVRKQGGQVIVSAHWRLAADGRTLRDDFTQPGADGSDSVTHYVYKRMKGGSGFTADWESTTPPTGFKYELQIQAYEGKGLSFVSPGLSKSIIFDGRNHPVPGAADGVTATGRRQGARAVTYTEDAGGKFLDARTLRLSADGKTLTMNIRRAGQVTPGKFVFERE